MTENQALDIARAKLRAEKAAYMREWRKKNPEKDKANRERCKQKKLERYAREVKENGNS